MLSIFMYSVVRLLHKIMYISPACSRCAFRPNRVISNLYNMDIIFLFKNFSHLSTV